MGMDGKELNLVHRDVSPQNVLISFEGDIKLCDFGIAKAATKVQQTQAGALKGKLQYMSPEQAWGKKVDRRTDIFSLGVVLYEMLTGERLFSGDTDLTILEQVRDARSTPPSAKNGEVPPKVDQIVLKALAKNPQDRYQNASEMERDINSVLYSFQPAPGPADLAIFLHRLVEATPVASDAQIDAAFAQAAAAAPAPEEKKKGKGLVISKKEKVPEPIPVPEPVEVSQPAISVAEDSGKSRTGLFAGIGVAAVVLIAAAVFMTRGKKEEPAPAPVAAPTAAAEPAPATTEAPAAPEKVIDAKALEAELKKATAEEAKKLREAAQKAAAEKQAKPASGAAATSAPAVSMAPSQPLQPPRPAATATPVPAPTRAPEPTPVPVRPTEPPRAVEAPRPAAPAAPAPAAAVREGDLVGAGPGVQEPRLVKLGAFPRLPAQARRVTGPAAIMALVDERGRITQTRVLKSSGNPVADEAAVSAVKGAQIEPATKAGVRVKMWKTFSITVK
jgi:TonB family protein